MGDFVESARYRHCEWRPDWSKSSIKKLVARLKAAGGDTGAVYSRKRSFTEASSAQVDELRDELPTLPRVSVAVVAKNLGPPLPQRGGCCTTEWKKKADKATRAQRISVATRLRRLVFCRCIRLRLCARLRLCKEPSLPTLNVQRAYFSFEKVYKCEYLQHPQNFRYSVDRTRKRMDCADLLRTDRSQFNPGITVAMVVGWHGIAGVHFVEPGGQGQQCLLLRAHADAVLSARHARESSRDERTVSLLRGQRAQPRVGLHSRVHSVEQAE